MPQARQTLVDVGLLLLRVSIGLYLLLAGVGKVQGELKGFGSFYRGPFKSMQPEWLPNALAAPYGYVLPWAEVIVGALLILGLFGSIAAALAGLMILSFTIALAMQHGQHHRPARRRPGRGVQRQLHPDRRVFPAHLRRPGGHLVGPGDPQEAGEESGLNRSRGCRSAGWCGVERCVLKQRCGPSRRIDIRGYGGSAATIAACLTIRCGTLLTRWMTRGN